MKRVLLLCFIHGFKGTDDTFRDFPEHLKAAVADKLGDDLVESVVYPKYETKGELAESTGAFLEWLKGKVVDQRKRHLETPWPPNDRRVGVILVAHSMGGFVASDALFRVLDEKRESEESGSSSSIAFPFIQGILAFDTPYNGLARSMFVYGAFSNYQKVSSVFNVMTALSAAAPATLSRLTARRAAGAAASTVRASAPAWQAWQLVAVRTGTVGAIAAGGVAAYTHRKQIMDGMRSVRNLNRESVVQGYQQGMDTLGHGLAYINRGNVGQSFVWLSEHVTFVGALMKQQELSRRLERLAALRGVGIHDFYASMGENGYWSGGYFVPERTFCAVPGKDQPAALLFSRHVVGETADEIAAHVSLFKPDKNQGYERMVSEASNFAISWFHDETELFDDPKLAAQPLSDKKEAEEVDKAIEQAEGLQSQAHLEDADIEEPALPDDDVPDESPLDIAAAASLVPLPENADGDDAEDEESEQTRTQATDEDDPVVSGERKRAYLTYLLGIAQQAGADAKAYMPRKLPKMDMSTSAMPKMTVPTMPAMPTMPKMPNVTLPSMGMFSKTGTTTAPHAQEEMSQTTDQVIETAAPVGGNANEESEPHVEVQKEAESKE